MPINTKHYRSFHQIFLSLFILSTFILLHCYFNYIYHQWSVSSSSSGLFPYYFINPYTVPQTCSPPGKVWDLIWKTQICFYLNLGASS